MISLGQVALLTIGCWVGTRLAYATSLPFPLLLLAAGGITCAIGMLVGLPALRLSGLYLALITLMFAGATTIVLVGDRLPERRRRLQGPVADRGAHDQHAAGAAAVDGRPRTSRTTATPSSSARSCSCSRSLHVAGKPGRAWASIRESEPAALAAGVNITLYKLWAFALASFITGVAGCLLAAQVGVPRAITFQTQDSLTLAATALIGGIFSLWGAVVAGIFQQLVPFLFQAQWGLNSNLAPDPLRRRPAAGAADRAGRARATSCRRISRELGRLVAAPRARAGGGGEEGAVIEVAGPDRPLRRRHADRRHERRLPRRDVRPDRPERRRQDDVLQRPQRLRQARRRVDRGLRRRTCSGWPTTSARAGVCGGRSRRRWRSRSCPSSTTSR